MSYCSVHKVSSTKEGTFCMICVLQLFHFLIRSVENPVIIFVKGIHQSVGSQSIYQHTRGNSWCSTDIPRVTRDTTTDLNRHRQACLSVQGTFHQWNTLKTFYTNVLGHILFHISTNQSIAADLLSFTHLVLIYHFIHADTINICQSHPQFCYYLLILHPVFDLLLYTFFLFFFHLAKRHLDT